MAHHRTARMGAKPSLTALVALAALALVLPGGSALADKQPASTDVVDIALAIERGVGTVQEGVVSWYGAQFQDRKTASGERFDSGAFTMAHPRLPFGTMVRVTNLRNGRSVVVRVNDRGPFVGKRIADLSQAAASEIGMMRKGVARARIEVLDGEAASTTTS
ncbi:MAG: septal ring lytic transglycosylase RlpA family protein [Steroidobacteraceae bacterium]